MGHYEHFSLKQRKVIQKMSWSGKKLSDIAISLNRHPSSIKREIYRNKSEDGLYRAHEAHSKYLQRKSKIIFSKIHKNEKLRLFIIEKILRRWSPEYISGRLLIEFPDDLTMRISHESIYQWLYALYFAKNILLWKYLPRKRRKRNKRQDKTKSRISKPVKEKKSIHERPEEAEKKEEIGHWEGDTVVGKNNDGYTVTLLERVTQLYLTAWMPNKEAGTCVRAIIEAFGDIPNEKIKTITFDNGTEFANFTEIEELFECDVFFADPYSSWQRGSNERSNGLLRRFYPKGTSFKDMNEKVLEINTKKINYMPRKILNFLTPFEAFYNNFIALQN